MPAVAVGEGLELLDALVCGEREGLALVIDVVLLRVALGSRAELGGDVRLELVEMGENRSDLHPTFSTFTAPVFSWGCFDTGSQIVIVNSFAARGRPSGPASSPVSQ
jgi:hypothetical protein